MLQGHGLEIVMALSYSTIIETNRNKNISGTMVRHTFPSVQGLTHKMRKNHAPSSSLNREINPKDWNHKSTWAGQHKKFSKRDATFVTGFHSPGTRQKQ